MPGGEGAVALGEERALLGDSTLGPHSPQPDNDPGLGACAGGHFGQQIYPVAGNNPAQSGWPNQDSDEDITDNKGVTERYGQCGDSSGEQQQGCHFIKDAIEDNQRKGFGLKDPLKCGNINYRDLGKEGGHHTIKKK